MLLFIVEILLLIEVISLSFEVILLDNVVMSLANADAAEDVMRQFSAEWDACNYFFMGAFEKESDDFVAQIYVGPVRWELPEFELGFFVDVEHEGQGYVTEAVRSVLTFIFEHLKAHRVRMQCDDTNLRSLRVAERCGFVREGHFRENKRNADGSLSGTCWYGLLRREYEASIREE